MGRWVPNSGVGSLVIRIRQFLKGQGWAINHHQVKPQAIKCFETKLDINEHFSSGVMLEQLGHCHSCLHDLIWVHHLLRWDNSNDKWWATLNGFLPPQGLCNLCEPRQRAWGLVVRYGLEQHKLLGWSGRCFCFCGSPMAAAVGWPLLWVADRDPLGQALLLHVWLLSDSWGTAFINHGEVISICGDAAIAMKISPSVKVARGCIVHWSSCTLLARQ